ncbi:MAG: hypothetical protein FJX66_08810 [Alphaproteobacteria bacterium]|nr:hypothetical protein [Alphaproteobacteria bacterium]
MPTKVASPNSPKKAPPPPSDEPSIGKVETIEGECTVTHVNGTKSALAKDAPIYQGDLIETGSNGKLSILFIDSSTFALGSDGSMVLDELVYDPKSNEGHSLANISKGVFVYVSGEIADNNPDKVAIKTPVMTIGIRGTKIAGVAAPEGTENKVALLPEEDGSVGKVVVTNDAGSVVLDAANELTKVVFGNVLPSVPEVVAQAVVNELFDEAISQVPFLNYLGGAAGILGTITDLVGGGSDDSAGSDTSNSRNAVDNEGSSGSNDSGGGGVTDLLDSIFHHDPRLPDWLDDHVSIDHLLGEAGADLSLVDQLYGAGSPLYDRVASFSDDAEIHLGSVLVGRVLG